MTPQEAALLADLDVSRETEARLTAFVELVARWTPKINLISRSSLPDVWMRHIIDSVQVFTLADSGDLWVDIGSGGGFPGIVAAICAREARPDARFVLIESDQRKAAFLRTAIRELDLKAEVIAKRIGDAPPQGADILSARALADLAGLLEHAERHLAPGGTALFPKGESWQKELAAARRAWQFEAETITSLTNPNSVILCIKGISRG
jgi:16S rRNA (guanine527-N7)-methyltransferase